MAMETAIVVQVIGAPVACAQGVEETWRDVANWAAGQPPARYGAAVHVDYLDLFDLACPALSPGAQLPVVLVNGELLRSGSKISMPALCHRLEALGLRRATDSALI
jgi:hypothetical protein